MKLPAPKAGENAVLHQTGSCIEFTIFMFMK